MIKTLLILCSLLVHLPLSANVLGTKDILKLKPGESLLEAKKKVEGLKTSDNLKGASYEIETEKNLITSVRIDFKLPVNSEEFVSKDTKGFCLSQPMAPDIPINRTFFFDMKTQRRYELSPKGQIKSIVIQDIPGARANRECQFGEALLKTPESEVIKSVK